MHLDSFSEGWSLETSDMRLFLAGRDEYQEGFEYDKANFRCQRILS